MADRVGQQLGHYRLLRKIGQGAFAEVYLGEHLYLERLAAIKVLHVQMEPETQEQFRREARTIAHLQHLHIVQVLDFGLDDQTPYLVMEYTAGGTLHSQHPKGTELPYEQIVSYVKQIASALDYAHQQRVIHRDVKPANLLLNARGQVVLSDFGLAVVQRSRESLSTQEPAGTPLYMAPEQIRHHPCAASDQYALGIMVYQWLCGEPPFRGPLYAVLAQHLSEPPPSLCQRLPDLPSAVEDAVFGALAKEPQQRFPTVQDFALALSEACFGTQPLSLWWATDQQSPDQDAAPAMPPVLLTPQPTGTGQPVLAPRPALQQPPSKVGQPTLAQSNRQRFLRRVRALWIDGVLEHSLHGAALIALGLQEQRDALANPWHLVLQHRGTAPRSFPLGTRITQVYDAANGELLILGAPGSGKTTLLLELARDLLDRADQDEQHLLPVVFNLSSWAARRLPLAEWMMEELYSKYQVPRKLAKQWVEAEQMLPLLDGLDEVAPEGRTDCIETINRYRQEYGFLPLVVCSRSADYLAQHARVKLSSAVSIQSLTGQQVENYLASGGQSLWALRVAWHQDATLRELTQTPLLLSILTLTYHNMPVEDLLRAGIAPSRQQIFERYVEQMLAHRGVSKRVAREPMLKWLTFLATQMQRHQQTVFQMEDLQADWLAGWSRRLLYRLTVGLVFGLVLGLAGGLVSGLDNGLHVGLLDGLRLGLLDGLLFGLIAGLVGLLIYGLGQIKPKEVLTRSWRGTKRSIVMGLVFGLVVGLISGLVFGLVLGLVLGLVVGLVDGSLGGLVAILVAGFSTSQLDAHLRLTPNQGIWRSARNGLVVWLVSGLVVWLVSGLVVWLVNGLHVELLFWLHVGLISGLGSGLVCGLVCGLGFGLGPFFQHFALRFWLWRTGSLPWNLVTFLDEAAERILLRKVGGGYIFVHRLLLEYFASLDTPSTSDAARAKKEQGEPAS